MIVLLRREDNVEIIREQTEEKVILRLSGWLNNTTAPMLQDALLPEFDQALHVELDLKKTPYVSSAGLRVLLMAEKKAVSKHADFVITNVTPEVMEVFKTTGFASLLGLE
jgi:anti-anti-sigma factor